MFVPAPCFLHLGAGSENAEDPAEGLIICLRTEVALTGGPRGPLKGPRGPFKGPRGPFKGPRGPPVSATPM